MAPLAAGPSDEIVIFGRQRENCSAKKRAGRAGPPVAWQGLAKLARLVYRFHPNVKAALLF